MGSEHTLLLYHAALYNLEEYLILVGDKDVGAPGIGKGRQLLPTFFSYLARGLQFIHESNIRHEDIKSENILVDVENKNICYTDFSISLDFTGGASVTSGLRGSQMVCQYI